MGWLKKGPAKNLQEQMKESALSQQAQSGLAGSLGGAGGWNPGGITYSSTALAGYSGNSGVGGTVQSQYAHRLQYTITLPSNPKAGTKVIVEFDGKKWMETTNHEEPDMMSVPFTLEELEKARELIDAQAQSRQTDNH